MVLVTVTDDFSHVGSCNDMKISEVKDLNTSFSNCQLGQVQFLCGRSWILSFLQEWTASHMTKP